MWYQDDYEELFDLHQDAAEEYNGRDPNNDLAKTFFVAAHNLHDFRQRVRWHYGGDLDDRYMIQALYLHRGVDALFSLFWLTRHHQYTAAYGRIRFLLETYLVVRHFNRNEEKAGRKYREKLKDFREEGHSQYEADPLTKYFDGVRRNLQQEFEEDYDWYDTVMGQLSDMGAHPQGIRAMNNDSKVSKELECDIFEFGNVFNFGIASQYIRMFDHTSRSEKIREELDSVIVQVLLTDSEMPVFLEEDLEFGRL